MSSPCNLPAEGVVIELLVNGVVRAELLLEWQHQGNTYKVITLSGSTILKLKKDDLVSFKTKATGVVRHKIDVGAVNVTIQKLRWW